MKNHSVLEATSRAGLMAIVFAVGLAAPVLAQQPPPHPTAPTDKIDATRTRMLDESQREMQLRGLNASAAANTDPKQMEALMAQVEQDFKRILILHNEIVRAIATDKTLNYGFASDATGEIKKRATRLQSTLALHKPEGNERNQERPAEFNDAQLKDALITLCKQIKSFITNPIIETPGTVDARQLAKARSDLESIIEVSDHIRKSAERLKKTVQ